MTSVFETQDPNVIAQAFAKYSNVAEPWTIVDTIMICRQFLGSEQRVSGWFATFADFAAQERHSFFKSRNIANAGLPYNNQKSQDSLDFVFICYNIGLRFWAPGIDVHVIIKPPVLMGEEVKSKKPNPEIKKQDQSKTEIKQTKTETKEVLTSELLANPFTMFDKAYFHLWAMEMLRHAGLQFKTQQDVILELNGAMAPPGYGTIGSGISNVTGAIVTIANPVMNFAGGSGVPTLKNRFPFQNPIALPRNATIEAVLEISEYGRYLASQLEGPYDIPLGTTPLTGYPARCGVTCSLIGKRLVQQRGEYHV